MSQGTSDKSGRELIVAICGLVIAIVGIVIALYSNSQSERAIQVAVQANDLVVTQNALLQESEAPRLVINKVYSFRDFYDDFKQPCTRQDGTGDWSIEIALAFDVSNLGGRKVSLVDIDDPSRGEIQTYYSFATATVRYDLFETRDDLLVWLKTRAAPGRDLTKQNLVFSALPVSFDPGETKRLLLRAVVEAIISKDVVPQEFQEALYSLNAEWSSDLNFVFAGNRVEQVHVPLQRPYQLEPGGLRVDAFKPCKV